MAFEFEDYKYLKVVVLPGTDNSSERPTVRDIALLENRLQFQKMGKSEYTAMDKALKLLQNDKAGIPLEEMLQDDPIFSGKNDKEFKKAVELYKMMEDQSADFSDKFDPGDKYTDAKDIDPKDRRPMELLIMEKMLVLNIIGYLTRMSLGTRN